METVKRQSRFSILPWIVPIVALIATGWLVYKSVTEAGVEIKVNFKDGGSLKEGKTFIKYKGFNVGKVTLLSIGEDLRSINAHIRLNHDVADVIAREGTDFWIVQPKVTVSEISGLNTIIGGAYIELDTNITSIEDVQNHKKKFFFKGYSEKPLKYFSNSG
ncbi:MAG: MlaD family protein, partial [Campylobacterales bacterium]|nr:MlaD family protein [Campylobacterales bacterium]